VTHREHLTWLYWLREEKNNPGINEHYLMMVGAEIRRSRTKNPKEVKLEDMRLEFSFAGPEEQEGMTLEEQKTYSDWLKQAYLARWKTKPPGVK